MHINKCKKEMKNKFLFLDFVIGKKKICMYIQKSRNNRKCEKFSLEKLIFLIRKKKLPNFTLHFLDAVGAMYFASIILNLFICFYSNYVAFSELCSEHIETSIYVLLIWFEFFFFLFPSIFFSLSLSFIEKKYKNGFLYSYYKFVLLLLLLPSPPLNCFKWEKFSYFSSFHVYFRDKKKCYIIWLFIIIFLGGNF